MTLGHHAYSMPPPMVQPSKKSSALAVSTAAASFPGPVAVGLALPPAQPPLTNTIVRSHVKPMRGSTNISQSISVLKVSVAGKNGLGPID